MAEQPPINVLIREARPDDAAAIVAIFNPIIEAGRYTIFTTPFTVEAEREFIEQFPAQGIFHVAVHVASQRVLGFQSMSPFASYSRAFDHVGVLGTFVDLAMRCQGITRQLFQATFAAAKQKGYTKLFTYVRADNPAGLATYLSQGFRIVGMAQQHANIDGRFVDEIIIEKLL